MPIPEELLPRTPKNKKPISKSGDLEITEKRMTQNVTTDYNRTPNNEPKKSFQWRLVTTRILPIFLGVLLVAGVSIAAVPSWRAAFNKFIAKFSPQASEVSQSQCNKASISVACGHFALLYVCENDPGGFTPFNAAHYTITASFSPVGWRGAEGWREVGIFNGDEIKAGDPVTITFAHGPVETTVYRTFYLDISKMKGDIINISGSGGNVSSVIEEARKKFPECFDINKACNMNLSGNIGNVGNPGSFTVTFIPKDKTHPTNLSFTGAAEGYYETSISIRVPAKLGFNLKLNAPEKVDMKKGTDAQGNQILTASTNIAFNTFDDFNQEVSGFVSMVSPSDKIKFLVNGQEVDRIDDQYSKGAYNLQVKSYQAGKFTFNGLAKDTNKCENDNDSVTIEFKADYQIELAIDNKNPDNSGETWQEKDGYYQVPLFDLGTGRPKVKGKVILKDKEGNALPNKEIKVYPVDFDKTIMPFEAETDRSHIKVITNDSGEAEFTAWSDKETKGKFKAVYRDEYGNEIETVSKNKDGNEMGVEFGEKISNINQCTYPSAEQENDMKKLEEELIQESPPPLPSTPNSINIKSNHWFDKIASYVKILINKFAFLQNKVEKVHSAETSPQLVCLDGKEFYPGNKRKIVIKGVKSDSETSIDIELPKYLKVLSISENAQIKETDSKKILTWSNVKNEELTIETQLPGYNNDAELKNLLNSIPSSGDDEFKAYKYKTSNPDKKEEIKPESEDTNKFHINILANYPELKIQKIKRKVTVKVKQDNGSYKEEEQDKEINIPIDFDYTKEPPKELKPYFYYDKNEKKWKEKIFPGDEISYHVIYNHRFKKQTELNDKLPDLKKVDLFFIVPDYADLISSSRDSQKTELKNVYKTTYELISKNKQEILNIKLKVKDIVSWDNKYMRLWTAIGSRDYKALSSEKNSENKFVFLIRDIWTNIKGKITGPYGFSESKLPEKDEDYKPLPGVTLGVFDDDNKLIYGIDLGLRERFSTVGISQDDILEEKQTFITDEEGEYQFECDRNWFFNKKMMKLAIFFDNDYIGGKFTSQFPVKIDNMNVFTINGFYLLIDKDITEFKGLKNDEYNIKIRKKSVEPNLEYPVENNIISQAKVSVDIWTNIYLARKILKDNNLYDTTNSNVRIIIMPNIPCLGFLCESAFYFPRTDQIFIGGEYMELTETRSSHTELHEFSHKLEYSLGLRSSNLIVKGVNHQGYLNAYSHDSFLEGFAGFLPIFLDNETKKEHGVTDYSRAFKTQNQVMFFIDNPLPIFDRATGHDPSLLPPNLIARNTLFNQAIAAETNQGNPMFEHYLEEFSVAQLLNCLTGYCEKRNAYRYDWLKPKDSSSSENKDFIIGNSDRKVLPYHDMEKLKVLFNILKDKKPKHLKDLYDAYSESNYFNGQNINEIGLDYLDQVYVLLGVWEDTSPDWVWQKNETIGTSGNHEKTMYMNFNSYNDIDIRPNRQNIFYNGSFVKYNFKNQDGSKPEFVKLIISGKYDYENKTLADEYNFDYEYYATNGQLTYFSFPPGGKPGKIYIRAEGSPDYLVLSSSDYATGILSTTNYDYFLSKNFTIVGSAPPTVEEIIKIEEEKSNRPTPTSALTPTTPTLTLNVVDDSGNKIDSTSGGSSVHVETPNFKGGKTADVYVNNKKVETVSLVNGGEDGFGLKVKIPDNISIGTNEIKIVDDQGKVASAKVNITSNKWFNKNTFVLIISIFLFAVAGYFIYRRYHKIPKLISY